MEEKYYGTGKRKTSIARVWIKQGSGKIIVNKKPVNDYFGRKSLEATVKQPLKITNNLQKYDVLANVGGGGLSGQAAAIRHGVSKALLQSDPHLRLTLKRAGLLTRDARIKERKKYGQKGARKKFQFSKR